MRIATTGISKGFVCVLCIFISATSCNVVYGQLITKATGDAIRIDPPNTLRRTAYQDNKNTILVEEQQGLFLRQELVVDLGGSGLFTEFPRPAFRIPSETEVDCTLVFVSPMASDTENYDLTITFASSILGVIATRDGLESSNEILGNSQTDYPSKMEGNGLNLDGSPSSDSVSISADKHTVKLHIASSGQLKLLRLITDGSGPPDLSHLRQGTVPVVNSTRPTPMTHTNNRSRQRIPANHVYILP